MSANTEKVSAAVVLDDAADAGSCLVTKYFNLMPRFVSEMTDWIQSGHVVSREIVEVGLERAVPAFLMLFSGANVGKMLVRLDE